MINLIEFGLFAINYKFDLALFGVLGIGDDSITIAALEEYESERLCTIHIFIVEQEILIQSEPFNLPLGTGRVS